jgi:hypothetical protein
VQEDRRRENVMKLQTGKIKEMEKKSCKEIDVGKRIVGISGPVSVVFKDDVQEEGT